MLQLGGSGGRERQDLAEIIEELSSAPRSASFGHSGIGQRGLGRSIQHLLSLNETHEDECMFAGSSFESVRREIYDSVTDRKGKVVPEGDGDRRGALQGEGEDRDLQRLRERPRAIRKGDEPSTVVVSEDDRPDKIVRIRGGNGEAAQDRQTLSPASRGASLTTAKRAATPRQIRAIYARRVTQDPNYASWTTRSRRRRSPSSA
jgi:serine protein kinase